MDNREFPEILVECHQDPPCVLGPCQYHGVTWIGSPVTNLDDFVAGVTECCGRFARPSFMTQRRQETVPTARGRRAGEPVVRTGLEALDAGRPSVVSGWTNYLVTRAVRLATRAAVVNWSLSIFRPRHP